MKTAVVSDTNSGIDNKMSRDLNVYIVPMPVIIDDKIFYEGDNLTEKEFFHMLSLGKHVSTSQPSISSIRDIWDKVLNSGYDELVYIPMSSSLSKSYETSLMLSKDYHGKVEVIDNHRISVTLMESVLQAKKLASEGKSSLEIKKILEDDTYNSVIYLSVNDLEYLKRGGRIHPAVAMLGTILSIKPILIIKRGKIELFSRIRGNMRKCENKMIESMKNDLANKFCDKAPGTIRIGAAGAGLKDEEKHEWIDLLRSNFPTTDVFYSPLSASISCHTGPGAVGVGMSFIKQN